MKEMMLLSGNSKMSNGEHECLNYWLWFDGVNKPQCCTGRRAPSFG